VLLPRLVDLGAALDLMTSGRVVAGPEALALGMIDALAEGDIDAACLQLAAGMPRPPVPVAARPVRLPEGDLDAFFAEARARARALAGGPAPEAIVACVETTARKSLSEARAHGLSAFLELAAGPEAKALQYLFFSERKAGRVAGLDPAAKPLALSRIGVVGAGVMGTGISAALAAAGYRVTLHDADPARLAASMARLPRFLDTLRKRGRAPEGAEARVGPAGALADLAGCDLVIEAVVEKAEVKHAVFAELDNLLPPGTPIATNTSYLDIDALAAATSRPGRVVGTHFFTPAHLIPLLEVVRGAATDDETLLTATALARRLGKTAIVARVCDGFIGNRMVDKLFTQACALLMEGAGPAQVDGALERFGLALGPFAMADMAGNDIFALTHARRRAADPGYLVPPIGEAVAAAGWHGQKAGAGWYLYAPEAPHKPLPHPALEEMLAQMRTGPARAVEDAEIVERCIFALIDEGARVFREGIAERLSDIDLVYVRGYGFPGWRGGPMYHGAALGLDHVAARVAAFHAADQWGAWGDGSDIAALAETST